MLKILKMSNKNSTKMLDRILLVSLLILPFNAVAQVAIYPSKTCRIGLFYCDRIKQDRAGYNKCMNMTCRYATDENSTCQRGVKSCNWLGIEFQLCMRYECGFDKLTKRPLQCKRGLTICNEELSDYWECVYDECLGEVSRFQTIETERQGRSQQKTITSRAKRAQSSNGRNQSSSDSNKISRPPEDVDVIPFLSKIDSSPISSVKCKNKYASLICDRSSILTCKCSDGSVPLMR